MNKACIPILMYHSISSPKRGSKMRGLSVPKKLFTKQMQILNFLGYRGLSLEKLEPYLLGKKTGKVVGITFDDGYQDNFDNALGVLKKYNFSATCFIVSNQIDGYNKWDLKKGIERKKLMNSLEIQEWIACGMEIGSHTCDHVRLTQSTEEEKYRQIESSKIFLERNFNIDIKSFCYPYGAFDQLSEELVRKFDYKLATTVNRGKAIIGKNMFTLPRVLVNHRTYSYLFILKLLTNYENKRG